MAGSRMQQVKDTLHIFLRSLGEGTQFNIIGFGSRTQHLFPSGSVEYNDKCVRHTTHTSHITPQLNVSFPPPRQELGIGDQAR
jgi:hypothetical protein